MFEASKGTSKAMLIFLMNHPIMNKSNGESVYLILLFGWSQFSGNSACAKPKNEYDSVLADVVDDVEKEEEVDAVVVVVVVVVLLLLLLLRMKPSLPYLTTLFEEEEEEEEEVVVVVVQVGVGAVRSIALLFLSLLWRYKKKEDEDGLTDWRTDGGVFAKRRRRGPTIDKKRGKNLGMKKKVDATILTTTTRTTKTNTQQQ